MRDERMRATPSLTDDSQLDEELAILRADLRGFDLAALTRGALVMKSLDYDLIDVVRQVILQEIRERAGPSPDGQQPPTQARAEDRPITSGQQPDRHKESAEE